MDSPNPRSMRVLTRPPPTPVFSPSPSASPFPISSPDSASAATQLQPPSLDGVVVVGFISRRPGDSCQLINRVLDSNVFGSGNLDKVLTVDKEEVKDWFKSRKISYYHEEEKGILFLHYSSANCPAMDRFSNAGSSLDVIVEEREFEDLQGLLFMFSVCHVVVHIQEGSRFDTQNLKKFRVLQAAKNALAPYAKSRTAAPLPSRPRSSLSSRAAPSTNPSNNSSPGRGAGILNRNASSVSVMSGLGSGSGSGSYPSLFPGQCTPVILFVFIDDFSDIPNSRSNVDEATAIPSSSQSSSLSNMSRSTLAMKGSGSVVVLARPVSKSEGGSRKKLQSSLEAQVRFLIKKCRILTGSESSHAGSRSGGISNSSPLFSLDASRAVVLLDRCTNKRGESLEYVTSLVEDVLNGKASSDSLLLESHSKSADKEDMLSVREFIYRQSDILRDRRGLVANTNNGSGVGMLAVAVAAAAASAASRKTFTTPELPRFDIWISSSQLILLGLLTATPGPLDETEVGKRKPRPRNINTLQVEGIVSKGSDRLDFAISLLESGRSLNTKFSTSWCERALPTAKDVYLKDLPACYPTSLHETHLQKALQAFNSMVRGPAVQMFTRRLEDECTSIWKSGRQLCDAVSLTGKPCMHERHEVSTDKSLLGAAGKPHSSGYVFLHACACGRSRLLRQDPFDFESANIASSCFADCDKLLPSIQLPDLINEGPIRPSSWSLFRIGGGKYYEPSKGLLQSGFCSTEKFLFKWIFFLENQKIRNGLPAKADEQDFSRRTNVDTRAVSNAAVGIKKISMTQLGDVQNEAVNQRKPFENSNLSGNKISFGNGLPNFTMKKPFSEVVAGSAATVSAFPPLQQRKSHSAGLEKDRQIRLKDQSVQQGHMVVGQRSQKPDDVSSGQETLNGKISINGSSHGDPVLQIGSYVLPVNMTGGEKVKTRAVLQQLTVYVGFEHECPYGHRFLLNPEHLSQLGSSCSMLKESHRPSSAGTSSYTSNPSKLEKNAGYGKGHRKSNRMTSPVNKITIIEKTKQTVPKGNTYIEGVSKSSGPGKEQNQTSVSAVPLSNITKDLETRLQSLNLDDGGEAFSMVNRNLPIYMNCPHCKHAKKDHQKNKFASKISQLQRIFLVTPPFPVVLATCPVIQFEESCLPPSEPDREHKLQSSLGCRVILPADSFITLRLPFVYGVQLQDGALLPLKPFEQEPEATAWIVKGTTLQVMSEGSSLDEFIQK